MVSFQDPVLNELKKSQKTVEVHFTAGDTISGVIQAFDQFVIILRVDKKDCVVYKNNITFIEPRS